MNLKLTKRSEDYAKWYTEVVMRAELADYAPVKGCMVIRPNGYALWEKIQAAIDSLIKKTGHQNAYFPLFIPQSFMEREAEHVEGFAPECAVVTEGGGKKLEEPLVVRPTSETIIYHMFAKWIMSYRDLPLLINQWANIVRWEMRTRLFLRTTEFLWQEGHTAHASYEEAEEETLRILDLYTEFLEDWMAIPVIRGKKSESEKFAGALHTYCVEAMMQDRKALQAGTSHNLGQNFARVFDVKYQTKEGREEYVWNTSWGVSTRLIGALVMTHGDDIGLIIPPRLAPVQAVIVPIWTNDEEKRVIEPEVRNMLEKYTDSFTIRVDDRTDLALGRRFYLWEERGVPLRIEIGPKDVSEKSVLMVRRDTGEKMTVPLERVVAVVGEVLDSIQENLYMRAKKLRDENTYTVDDYEAFRNVMESEGGFISAHWCGGPNCEEVVKEQTKATIRCIPFDSENEEGRCIVCQKASPQRVIFAKAY
ncbi:MAG: proline--tRNA ligase [Candidatus Glassbacteria bacterium]